MYGLSKQETAIMAQLSAAGKTIFSLVDVAALKIGSKQSVWPILSRLANKGWIRRLRRATYMIVPFEAGVNQAWAEDSFKLAQELFSPCYIAYRSALSHWQLTDQVPAMTAVAVPKQTKLPQSAAIRRQFRLVRLAPYKFFGFSAIWRDRVKVNISDASFISPTTVFRKTSISRRERRWRRQPLSANSKPSWRRPFVFLKTKTVFKSRATTLGSRPRISCPTGFNWNCDFIPTAHCDSVLLLLSLLRQKRNYPNPIICSRPLYSKLACNAGRENWPIRSQRRVRPCKLYGKRF